MNSRKQPDIIFLDSALPDGTGRDFAELIKQNKIKGRLQKNVVLVSVSGNSEDEQKKLYEGYEVSAFIQKPLIKNQILDLLKLVKGPEKAK